MRVLIQRVHSAEVAVASRTVGRIDRGLLVYLGIGVGDSIDQAKWLGEKVSQLRIFEDEQGKMNMSVQDARGGVLAIPNFTLLADARKGRRPAFVAAARPEQAEPLFEAFVSAIGASGLTVAKGVFGAEMTIRSDADGPVNIVLDAPTGGDER